MLSSIFVSFVRVVLFLLLAHEARPQDLRLLGCVEPVCGQHTSYYNARTGLLEIFVSETLTPEQMANGMRLCVMIGGDPSKHCYADEHGRVQVDMALSQYQAEGITNSAFIESVIEVRRRIQLSNGTFMQNQEQDKVESHYIMIIPKADDSSEGQLPASLLAYTKVMDPSFGSIVSRKLVIDYEANEVAKKEAGFVLFNVDGVYEGQLSAMRGTLMTYENNHTSNNIGKEYRDKDDDGFVQGVHVEPASWFFKLQPALKEDFLQAGGLSYPSFGYLEWVLERHVILKSRVFGYLEDPSRRLLPTGGPEECSSPGAAASGGSPVKAPHVLDVPVADSVEPEKSVRVCLWTSSNMDGQKRIWLRQMDHLSLPPYSGDAGAGAGQTPLKFVVFLTSESNVAPDVDDPVQVQAYERLVREYRSQEKGGGGMAALSEYERRLLDFKLGGSDHVEVVRAPTLGATISRDRITEPIDGQPSPLAYDASVESVLRFVQQRFRAHTRDARADGSFHDNGEKGGNNTVLGPRRLDTLEPVWVREIYQRMVTLFEENRCSVSVHGNLRGFNADFLITDTARYLSIPTVSELLNLFPDPDTASDVVVGPSWYSLEHESMRRLRDGVVSESQEGGVMNRGIGECVVSNIIPLPALPTAEPKEKKVRGRRRRTRSTSKVARTPRQVLRLSRAAPGGSSNRSNTDTATATATTEVYRHSCGPLTMVISPGVDSDKFSPAPGPAGRERVSYPGCVPEEADPSTLDAAGINSACFIVGFVARLSSEKNPGLFVQMASSLLALIGDEGGAGARRKVRFLVLGDGHLKAKLTELARRAGLIDSFAFVGWVSAEELPSYLHVMDVVVNPSVRAWSETFCIANIEVMGMARPLVTFGAGGVGEYIDLSAEHERDLCLMTKGAVAAARAKRDAVCSDSGEIGACEVEEVEDTFDYASDYTVTKNAVLVHSAHPVSLAGAVLHLYNNATARAYISANGRETVKKHFQPNDQLWKYADLYRFLADKTATRRRLIMSLFRGESNRNN